MTSYPIPDGPHNDSWKALLPEAFAVIDEVVQQHGVDFPVQIGGGSMLARRYGHRDSRDLDLFVSDVRLVRWCSPRLNDAADDLFADYAEDAASLKLVTGMQEVDVIAAAPLLDDGVEEDVLLGRPVLIERPREILAKKLFYRGRRLEPRDVFDIAAVAEAEPGEVAAAFSILPSAQLEGIAQRLRDLEPAFGRQISRKVNAWPAFDHVKQSCLGTVRDLVDQWLERPARERDGQERGRPAPPVSAYPPFVHDPARPESTRQRVAAMDDKELRHHLIAAKTMAASPDRTTSARGRLNLTALRPEAVRRGLAERQRPSGPSRGLER